MWQEYWWFGWKWALILSVTVPDPGIDFVFDADANFNAAGATVTVTAHFNKLRLDYSILNGIPLEGLANSILGSKPLAVYDASKLIATIPIFESHFAVADINLPRTNGGITVEATVKQIPHLPAT